MHDLVFHLIQENRRQYEVGDPSYKTLDIGNCGLREIPNSVFELIWLEELIISNWWIEAGGLVVRVSQNYGYLNRLSKIPLDLLKLRKLKSLRINGCLFDKWNIRKIENLPTGLSQLDISSNKITRLENLPDGLSQLFISSNRISELENLPTSLTILDIEHNRIKVLKNIPEGLTFLDIRRNQVNRLENLPESLVYLYIPMNQISYIKKLPTKLTLLDIGCNKIKSIDNLPASLTKLNLSYNQINQLESLPDGLVYLYAYGNQISQLINLPQSLRIADLRKNQIENFSISKDWVLNKGNAVIWSECPRNNQIAVAENPISVPPAKIVSKGNDAVLRYFRELDNKETVTSNEVRLILLGNSSSGKTSLSLFLRKREYNKMQSTTHGAELMHNWQPENNDLKINIWDFGGQEYYHATYNLFLGDKAVYIMVWDSKTNKNAFLTTTIFHEGRSEPIKEYLEHFHYSYWLANIRHYSKSSPIFLVCNKCEIPSETSRRISDHMVSRHSLNPDKYEFRLSIEKAFQSFKQNDKPPNEWLIQFELFQLRLVETLNQAANNFVLPKYWIEVKTEIMEMFDKPGYEFSKDRLKSICEKYDSSPDVDNVIIYLRDISGVIIHYPDNLHLSKKVFYNPNRINRLIYGVLDHSVKMNFGKFGIEHVVRIFKDDTKKATTFIELMQELEIIFEDNETPGYYIAPQYLPYEYVDKSKLLGAIEYADLKHAFTLSFPQFIPRSFIARFIARKGFAATNHMYWKHGILFKRRSLNAFVTCIYDDTPIVRVEIQDKNPRKRSELEKEIFLDFYDILNKSNDFKISADGKYFFSYENVIEAYRNESRYLEDSGARIEFEEFSNFILSSTVENEFSSEKKKKRTIRFFISYSEENPEALKKLTNRLNSIREPYQIKVWSDKYLIPSEYWKDRINEELLICDAVICIITHDFLENKFIWNEELPQAVQLAKPILPVIYESCDWKEEDYKIINKPTVLPPKGIPIMSNEGKNEADAWKEVKLGIRKLIARL